MARVSLIVPDGPGATAAAGPLADALRGAGHQVEVVSAPAADVPGVAASAVEGLKRATGAILVVVDPAAGYSAADLQRLIAPLAAGEADLAVGSRAARGEGLDGARRWRAGVGRLALPLVGTTDPTSRLIGITSALRDEAIHSCRAVGSYYSFELLARLGGRRIDVPARPLDQARRRPEFADVRHLKRLADHRFGNLSRLVQFCVVGGSGMFVDLGMYVLFKEAMGRTGLAGRSIPFLGPADLAAAAALAIGIALSWNFWLNRRLTFSYARHGSILGQYFTYAFSNLLGILLSFTLRLQLPRQVPYFAAHKLVAAVVGIVLATGINFSMARWVVFGRRGRAAPALVESSSPAP